MNNHTLIGRLTKKPELKYSNEKAWIKFTIAVNRKYKSKDGIDVDFFDCLAFGKSAEYIGNYADKGLLCAVSGSTEIGKYDDKQGITRKTVTVKCNTVELLERAEVKISQAEANLYKQDDSTKKPVIEIAESDLPF